ncbi:MAG: hypothetical protein QOJ07_3574 [Thermoleophilaceae bacterium]|jgi:prepilin signal peptidase PulO-like enzyme (type II secretory pathway)|nr:hypothetical protein [Thermoleophilaceae bacterium]
MGLHKVRSGEVIAAVGGVALIVALFLPWYGSGGRTADGWESLTVIDGILLFCALFGIALLVLIIQQRTPALPLAVAGLGAWLGLLAVALVLFRVAFTPGDGVSREWGLFVALAAAATLFSGAWRSLGDERIRMPDGRWSSPAHGEIGAGVQVSTLPPPEAGAAEGR